MRAPAKLAGFAAILALALGAGLAAGAVTGPSDRGQDQTAQPPEQTTESQKIERSASEEDRTMGLAIGADGYRLEPELGKFEPEIPSELRFAITGPDGGPVVEYDQTHERQLHLIIVSRDLSWFEHLHPELDAEGVWHQPLTLPAAGPYRAYADFAPAGATPRTLSMDVNVAGDYHPAPLPDVEPSPDADGYTVTLTGRPAAGTEAELSFTVTRNGRPVTDLDPYLGAYGHLVALRAGDLAYLHTHPLNDPHHGAAAAGPEVRFATQVPTAGTYRLFLDFSHAGVVRTAAFTVDVTESSSEATSMPEQESEGSDEHAH